MPYGLIQQLLHLYRHTDKQFCAPSGLKSAYTSLALKLGLLKIVALQKTIQATTLTIVDQFEKVVEHVLFKRKRLCSFLNYTRGTFFFTFIVDI